MSQSASSLTLISLLDRKEGTKENKGGVGLEQKVTGGMKDREQRQERNENRNEKYCKYKTCDLRWND